MDEKQSPAVRPRTRESGLFFIILGTAVLVRLPYLLFWDLFFNSDTAVLGLMARHFLRGEFSVYYWGEAYYGSLDPVLLAPLFKIFGPTAGVALWVPFVFSVLTVWVYYRYARLALDGWAARISALILALAPAGLFQITLSVFNYTFILFFGVIHLYLFEKFLRGEHGRAFFLKAGVVAGFSWYYFRLILVFWGAILLYWIVTRLDPAGWAKVKKTVKGFSFLRFWEDIVLLRLAPIPDFLKRCLTVVNIYNLANFLVACFLWIRGNWFFYIGRLRVKLYLWPILKSSLLLAVSVYAAVHYRKILPLLRSLWADARFRTFALGFLAGYSPALYGSLTGKSPSSPGGLVALPTIGRNVLLAVPEMISRLAGASRILPLQVLAIAFVICGFLVLGGAFWRQTRLRLQAGTPVRPFYAVLTLCLTATGFGLAGTNLRDANTVRFLVPLFLCIPAGVALGLQEIKKKSRLLAWGLLVVLIGNSLWSNVLVWRKHASPSRYESIALRLAGERVTGGYADYWSAYYLTFLTGEKIILAPISGKERYAPYAQHVQSMDEIVLVGEPVPAGRHRLEIKGVGYEVIREEVWEGLPVTFLRKSRP